ncbi:hypothetical protein WKK_00110 [Weissella koreensis KACC 15510]|nr:hypothetical protein WKK_00110 [Weissella koreensis KACC 15510]
MLILLLFLQFILLMILIIIFFRGIKFIKIFVDEKRLPKELLERRKTYIKPKINNRQLILSKWSLYMGIFFVGIAILMSYINITISTFIIGIALLLLTCYLLTIKKIQFKINDIKRSYINKHSDNDLEFSYLTLVDFNNYKTYINHLSFIFILLSIVFFLISLILYMVV